MPDTPSRAARLGAIAVPVNHRLAPGEVVHVLADSGATVLVRSAALSTRRMP